LQPRPQGAFIWERSAEGVLLEKAVGFAESGFTGFLLGVLNTFVLPRNLGIVTGPSGA
jgi:hypothetical protein